MDAIFDIATCMGCGCDDHHACAGGCGWLRVDRTGGTGVCTSCADHMADWDAALAAEHTPGGLEAATERCIAHDVARRSTHLHPITRRTPHREVLDSVPLQ